MTSANVPDDNEKIRFGSEIQKTDTSLVGNFSIVDNEDAKKDISQVSHENKRINSTEDVSLIMQRLLEDEQKKKVELKPTIDQVIKLDLSLCRIL